MTFCGRKVRFDLRYPSKLFGINVHLVNYHSDPLPRKSRAFIIPFSKKLEFWGTFSAFKDARFLDGRFGWVVSTVCTNSWAHACSHACTHDLCCLIRTLVPDYSHAWLQDAALTTEMVEELIRIAKLPPDVSPSSASNRPHAPCRLLAFSSLPYPDILFGIMSCFEAKAACIT